MGRKPAIHTDLNDADEKPGKLTAQTSAGIVGSWGGGALGEWVVDILNIWE